MGAENPKDPCDGLQRRQEAPLGVGFAEEPASHVPSGVWLWVTPALAALSVDVGHEGRVQLLGQVRDPGSLARGFGDGGGRGGGLA